MCLSCFCELDELSNKLTSHRGYQVGDTSVRGFPYYDFVMFVSCFLRRVDKRLKDP